MTSNLTPQQLGEVLAAAGDPEALEALRNAPSFVRETSFFPYRDGLAFVTIVLAGGGYAAVDAAFKDPPNSTEQILHPEKYVAREAPVSVTLPDVAKALGAGWTAAGQDTLGEKIMAIWLNQAGVGGVPQVVANEAAAGWGGDRLVVLRGPDGQVGIGMITTWDTDADTAEFLAAASTAVAARTPAGTVASDGLRTVLVAVGDRAPDILAALAE
jgi:hypothetical protein